MSEHDCLNNEDQLDSVLDEVAQIDSEFDSVDDIDSDLEKVVEVLKTPFNTISVNGENIEPDENKNINIEIPTKTSGFTNDGDGKSPFATEDFVETNGGKIDSISIDGVKQTIDENKNVELKGLASTAFVEGRIQQLVGLAPETLDTLEEIASELGNNEGAIILLNNKVNENTTAIEELRSSGGAKSYGAGEGLKLDAENKFNIVPATQNTFGGIRVWEEDGYLCFSTETNTKFKNVLENGVLTVRGAWASKQEGSMLILQ